MKNILFIATLFATLFITSCEKTGNTDTTKPVIELKSPAEGETLEAGSDNGVHFEMELSDDVALESYKIEIHNAFDGHSHAKAEGAHEHEGTPFKFYKVYDVSGKRNAHIHHHEIVIPSDATHGNYHLMVYCTDAAGNESQVARKIIIDEKGDHEHSDHKQGDHKH